MNITFSDPRMEAMCNKSRLMEDNFGSEKSKLLKRRLLQLAAANSLIEFSPQGSPPLKCKQYKNKKLFKIHICEDFKLIFSQNSHNRNRLFSCDEWATIKDIKIQDFEEITP